MFDHMKENVIGIHKGSMELLKTIGMRFADQEILDMLKENGIKVEGDRVYFTEDQIMKYVSMAPSEFKVYARNPKYDMTINTEESNFAPTYGSIRIREHDGKLRMGNMDDYLRFAELYEVLDDYKVNGGTTIQPCDVDVEQVHAIMTYCTLLKSEKCITTVTGTKKVLKEGFELISRVFGGMENLKKKTRTINLISTISPLNIDTNSIDCIKLCCEYNQAMIIAPAPMAGASGPVTLAGNLALGNAESLATIAVIQMIKPGTPVIQGSAFMGTDMRNGKCSIGSPVFALQGKYCSALSKYYKLPCRITGSLSDAKGVTAQTGYESMLNMVVAIGEKGNYIMHTSGMGESFTTTSYEKFVIDNEILSMLKFYYKDIEVNEKTLATKVVKEVMETTGTFMTHKHTVKNCRKAVWIPGIDAPTKFELDDTPDNLMKEAYHKRINQLLDRYVQPQLDSKIKTELDKYMIQLGIEKKVLEKCNEKATHYHS